MRSGFSHVQWALILKASVLLYVVTLILGLAVSFPLLAVLDREHLDSPSAIEASSLITTLLVVAVTGYGAWWVARKVDHAALLHGFLVGLVVALLSLLLDVFFLAVLFRSVIELQGVALYLLMVAAGLLGGAVGNRSREQS